MCRAQEYGLNWHSIDGGGGWSAGGGYFIQGTIGQPLTPAPYALSAAGLASLGNAPLDLKVNGVRGLRLELGTNSTGHYYSPNVIAGAPVNSVAPGVVGATIAGGGEQNTSSGHAATVGGGEQNSSSGLYATVGGGLKNTAIGPSAAIGGGEFNRVQSDAHYAVIGGGASNTVSGPYASLGGGNFNSISETNGTIGGGRYNTLRGAYASSTIGGGWGNYVDRAQAGTISGGIQNHISGLSAVATVGGGYQNFIETNGASGTIAGGNFNFLTGPYGTIGGGYFNTNFGSYATIPGGTGNKAAGAYSFAAGRRAKAEHDGSFVWAGSTDADFASTGPDQFVIRAAGGVGINTAPAYSLDVLGDRVVGRFITTNHTWGSTLELRNNTPSSTPLGAINFNDKGSTFPGQIAYLANDTLTVQTAHAERLRVDSQGRVGIGTETPAQKLHVSGNILATGTITPNSDRNAKTDFAPVDVAAVLAEVARLPIQQWRFKAESGEVKHVGPMAQDFHAAFGLGEHKTAIATVDADGVALAAIQGLNHMVEAENRQLREALDAKAGELIAVTQRLAVLERLLSKLNLQRD